MPAFPRTVKPRNVTPFSVPTGLVSAGHTGKDQLRNVLQMGREWTETWGPIRVGTVNVDAFLAYVAWLYSTSQVFTIDHLTTPGSGRSPNGAGGGTPLINGASQTGEDITTDGWSNSITGVAKGGDVLRIAGLSPLYQVVIDANSNGSGQATIKLNPPIPAGYSPADNAAITRASCTLNAYIAAPPVVPDAPPGRFIAGFSLRFREAIT
jgi:hypothetical protein